MKLLNTKFEKPDVIYTAGVFCVLYKLFVESVSNIKGKINHFFNKTILRKALVLYTWITVVTWNASKEKYFLKIYVKFSLVVVK